MFTMFVGGHKCYNVHSTRFLVIMLNAAISPVGCRLDPRIQNYHNYQVPILHQICVNYAVTIKKMEGWSITLLVTFCVAINVVILYLNNKDAALTAAE